MGLLGNVSQAEMDEALKGPGPFEAGTYPFVIDKAEVKGPGPSGFEYVETQLLVTRPSDGQTRRVYHNVSMSPKARGMAIQFLNALGLNPNEFESPDQLRGLQGTCILKVGQSNNGTDRNEVARFVR